MDNNNQRSSNRFEDATAVIFQIGRFILTPLEYVSTEYADFASIPRSRNIQESNASSLTRTIPAVRLVRLLPCTVGTANPQQLQCAQQEVSQ